MRPLLACLILSFAAAAAAAAAPTIVPTDPEVFQRELARRFQYGPPAPPPAETDDPRLGQARDAAYFAAFPDYDRAYSPAARAAARRLAARLRADAAGLSHEQFVLRVAEIAALADNGHTSIDQNAYRKNTTRLPLRTMWFADGLYVLQAAPAHANLLGARIDAIDGRPVEDIFRALLRYQGGTEGRRRTMLLPMLESPALLQAAGLAGARDALVLSGTTAGGQPFRERVMAEVRGRAAPVSATERTLYPRPAGDPLRSFLSEDGPLPVSLQERSRLFHLASLPGGGLYIGLDFNMDGDGEPIAPFLTAALERVTAAPPAFVVLDMRMNGGGDYTTTYGFAGRLVALTGRAPIYVLTSPWTFSAAITTVAAVKQAGGDRVRIVGAPVGDRLDFWAEGGAFILPNAFLRVYYQTGRHRYDGPCLNMADCFWLNLRYPVRVASLQPDIAAPWTFSAYRRGHDPALDVVLARQGAGAGRREARAADRNPSAG